MISRGSAAQDERICNEVAEKVELLIASVYFYPSDVLNITFGSDMTYKEDLSYL